jgi:hypothetical protein
MEGNFTILIFPKALVPLIPSRVLLRPVVQWNWRVIQRSTPITRTDISEDLLTLGTILSCFNGQVSADLAKHKWSVMVSAETSYDSNELCDASDTI